MKYSNKFEMESNTMMCLKSLVIFLLFAFSRGYDLGGSEEVINRTLPAFTLAEYADILNGTSCQKNLILFREAVNDRKLWSLKMLDSSGEPKPGFIYGNNFWLGVRSQCLDSSNKSPFMISEEFKMNNSIFRNVEEEFPPFEVHYFVAYFRHNSTLQYQVDIPIEDLITLGLCLPAECSMDEIGFILERIFQDRTLLISDLYKVDFKLVGVKDLTENGLSLGFKRVLILFIISTLLALMLIGTLYDVLFHQKDKKLKEKLVLFENNNTTDNTHFNNQSLETAALKNDRQSTMGKVLLCFSIYTNTKIIFDTKLGSNSIPTIHGLRFLGMVWIIMLHSIFYMSDYNENKPWAFRMAEGFAVQIIGNGTLAVDTFFFISGLLVGYLYLIEIKNEKEEKSINYTRKVYEFVGAVIKRFMRLTPAYMMMVGILELNSAYYGEVSQFYMFERPQEICAKYWWRNILYINNLFGRETMCMSWSWYLSNDMQFFIIGIFLLILSTICFYSASTILISLMVGSISITGYISYIHGYVPTMDAQYHTLDILYDPPWTRISPYIVGIITAYILVKLDHQLPLRTRTLVIGWILGSSCNLVVLFGIWQRYISVLSTALYVGFSRTVWAVGLSWLLIACCTNHGGIVNKILTFKGWIPLSRLTYCAYLINPFIINSIFLHSEIPQHVDFLTNGTTFMGVLVVTYFCAYAFSLMLETPNVMLTKLLTSRGKKR